MSGQIMRAKKTQSASTALTRAKSKLAMLQRAAGTGQYDSKEVANAIAHARRMVRAAQTKVKNLKEEEQETGKNSQKSHTEVQQKKNEIKRRAAQKEQKLKSEADTEKIQQVQKEKSRRQQMVQKRRAHRNQERSQLLEADMKYVKGELAEGRTPLGYTSSDNGVFIELSAASAELAMMENKIEAEIEQEIDAEVSAELSSEIIDAATIIPTVAAVETASAGIPSGSVAGGTVDVSV
jgi:hypothetical protein